MNIIPIAFHEENNSPNPLNARPKIDPNSLHAPLKGVLIYCGIEKKLPDSFVNVVNTLPLYVAQSPSWYSVATFKASGKITPNSNPIAAVACTMAPLR